MVEKSYKPKIPKSIYRKIEEDVTNLYLELGLTVPINPFEIADRLGYIVERLSEKENAKEIIELLNKRSNVRKDGISFFDSRRGAYVIIVNDVGVEYEERNNFTVIHEIGHIRLGHKTDSLLAEMMANYYAAYALAPSVLIKYFGCEDFVDVIKVFGVSDLCAWNCFDRYSNWSRITRTNDAERRLLEYYKLLSSDR